MSAFDTSGQANEWIDIPQTILVVDDDDATREFLELALAEEGGYTILSRTDGVATLETLDEIIQLRPDLFVIDYQLPTMTGVELYDRLHAVEALRYIPTIILTAHEGITISQQLVERQIELLAKPFDLDELLQCIEQVISQTKRQEQRAKQPFLCR